MPFLLVRSGFWLTKPARALAIKRDTGMCFAQRTTGREFMGRVPSPPFFFFFFVYRYYLLICFILFCHLQRENNRPFQIKPLKSFMLLIKRLRTSFGFGSVPSHTDESPKRLIDWFSTSLGIRKPFIIAEPRTGNFRFKAGK